MRLFVIFVIFALTFLLPTGTTAHEDVDKAQCAAVKKKIRHIRSRMRAGYTRAQGERMESQLRKLKKDRRLKCR